jgi:hypothetical protein
MSIPEENLLQLLAAPFEFQFTGGHAGARGVWSDVEVTPTRREIEQGSVLVEGASIDTETNCAICQEHQYPGASGTSQWRRLHCTHQFHRECIDLWFSHSVVCPQCRADIRDGGATTTTNRQQPPSLSPSSVPNTMSGPTGSPGPAESSSNTHTQSRIQNLREGTRRLFAAVAAAAAAEANNGSDADHEGQGHEIDNDI